jgi:hypothetical protein
MKTAAATRTKRQLMTRPMKRERKPVEHRMTKQEIVELDAAARKHIASVPYAVSQRWVFYRLLQDGIYRSKGDSTKFCDQASKFRHDGTWPADLLIDETRKAVYRGISKANSTEEIIENLLDPERLSFRFYDSHFIKQRRYVEIWFEARAMLGQFQHYTSDIVLRPFGGMTSIPMKYKAAKELEELANQFEKPALILYFGDSDEAGKKIYDASTTGGKGFLKWCDADVEVKWCGLNADQARAMDVPENPDKPGDFQWEALTDDQAREIIGHALQEHVDLDEIEAARKLALKKAQAFCAKLSRAVAGVKF